MSTIIVPVIMAPSWRSPELYKKAVNFSLQPERSINLDVHYKIDTQSRINHTEWLAILTNLNFKVAMVL